MFRYVRLLGVQLRASALLASQYRVDFIADGIMSLFWAATAVIPLFVVYRNRSAPGIPDWSFAESLVVIGWFIFLQGVLEGAINPGLTAVVDHVRKGTMDFILLKPADAQFLVSTSKFHLWRVMSFVTATGVFAWAFYQLKRWPTPLGVLQAVVLLMSATLILYSLWILIVSAAFFVVKVDNLTYLFTSIFDAARWPSSVFRGVLAFIFTFIVPLALMTTYPAQALLGRLTGGALVASVGGAVLFALAARGVWLLSIRRYTSAGG